MESTVLHLLLGFQTSFYGNTIRLSSQNEATIANRLAGYILLCEEATRALG
jgi:hypothetical protein